MILIDDAYSVYRDDDDPGYPGGKAVPVSAGNKTDGTPWRAKWFNTTLGFYQALIVEAYGKLLVNGKPDKVGESDLLDALKKVIERHIENLTEEAPDDGRIYGRKNKTWTEISGSGGGSVSGDAVEALKFYSKKTLMITNTRIIDRRKRGWDIGLPYPSNASEVYHFDTDLLNQHQESHITITGDVIVLADRDYNIGGIYLNPAVQDIPPYEMEGRSLYGFFTVKTIPQTAAQAFTAEAWIRFFESRSAAVLRLDSGMESITFRTGTKGSAETGYSAADEDGISYSVPEAPISYSIADADGVNYSVPESGGLWYSEAETAPIPYSVSETDPGNIVIHEWLNGSETASLDDEGVAIPQKTWIHIAAVAAPDRMSFYIGNKKIEFEKKSESAQRLSLTLNPSQNEFNVDELLLDGQADADFDIFSANSGSRVPYAALDYTEKWLVLEAQDPAKVKTNLFETEQFRAAVQAAVSSMV